MTDYTIEKNDNNEYIKVILDNNDPLAKYYWTCNTLYKSVILKYSGITNKPIIINKYNNDIIWFNYILIDLNDINKLISIKITIDQITIWEISIKLLIKLCKPIVYESKIKISLPTNLFLNHNYVFEKDLCTYNDLLGIPLLALPFSNVAFWLLTRSDINYDLFVKSIYCNNYLYKKIKENMHHISINDFRNKIKYDDYLEIPLEVTYELLNYNKIINYINNKNTKIRKEFILKLPMFINVINNIIYEYDAFYYKNLKIMDCEDNYYVCLDSLIIYGGQFYKLSEFN
jgi:hypothetical protein